MHAILPTDDLPDDIKEIWRTYENIRGAPSYGGLDTLSGKLFTAWRVHKDSSNVNHASHIAQLLIHRLQLTMSMPDNDYIPDTNMTRIISVTKHKETIDEIMSIEENRAIFCYSLMHSIVQKNAAKRYYFDEEAFVLSHLVKQEISLDTLSNPIMVADLLYGAGAWSIYRMDVAHDNDMPRHLLNVNAPLNGLAKVSGRITNSTADYLPEQLY